MKKAYLLPILILFSFIVTIFIFHNQIIQLSLPLFEESIKSQLNITDNKKTKYNIKADLKNKIIILEIDNPIFKSNDFIQNGYANSVSVKKSFNDIFNDKFIDVSIINLNIKLKNIQVSSDNKEKFVVKNIIPDQLKSIIKIDNFYIKESFIDLSSIFDNHQIYISELAINNKTELIQATGELKNQKSNSNFTVSNNINDNKSIYFELILDSYPLDFIKKISNNIYINKLSEHALNGKIYFKINENSEDLVINYNLFSIDKNIKANGSFNFNESTHESNISIYNALLSDYIKDKKISDLLNQLDFNKSNIEIKVQRNFSEIDFEIDNSENSIIITGKLKQDRIIELNIEGDNIVFDKVFERNQLNIEFLPNEIVTGFVKENAYSFSLRYKQLNKYVELKIIDNYHNKINLNFDLQTSTLNEFNVIFFNNEKNKFSIDTSNLTFNFIFNKDFNEFLIKNFNHDIYKLINLNHIDDFEKGYIKGKLNKEYLNNIINLSNISDIINSFQFSLDGVLLDYNKFSLLSEGFLINGLVDIFYEQNYQNKNKKILIDFNNTEIKIEKINFVKLANNPLNLSFDYINKKNNEILLNNFQIKGDSNLIEGNILLLDNTIKNANFKSFKLLNNDIKINFSSELDKSKLQNHLFVVDIQGKKLDLSFLNIKETKSYFSDININLNIDVNNLYYINNTNFIKAKLYGRFKNVWKSLRFRGLYDTEGDLNIVLNSNKEKQVRTFEITSSNAEKTLKIKKITKSITGGKLKFTGNYDNLNSDKFFNSKLFLEDFAIKKKSKLAGFIKVIRIFDIKKQLAGDTEDFEYAEMKISKQDKIFNLIEGKAYGGLMALTFDGKIDKNDDSVDIKGLVAPTHAIDSWIGKIPIFGEIITGIEGGGVIAANYTVKGTIKKPKYFANPLSILTPGIFKDFWKIFEKPS